MGQDEKFYTKAKGYCIHCGNNKLFTGCKCYKCPLSQNTPRVFKQVRNQILKGSAKFI